AGEVLDRTQRAGGGGGFEPAPRPRRHPAAEVAAIGGGEAGERRGLAAMLGEETQKGFEVARVAIDRMRRAAPRVGGAVQPLVECGNEIRRRREPQVGRVLRGYGFGRSSHVRMPNSITRPRKLMSSVPWPAWK